MTSTGARHAAFSAPTKPKKSIMLRLSSSCSIFLIAICSAEQHLSTIYATSWQSSTMLFMHSVTPLQHYNPGHCS